MRDHMAIREPDRSALRGCRLRVATMRVGSDFVDQAIAAPDFHDVTSFDQRRSVTQRLLVVLKIQPLHV